MKVLEKILSNSNFFWFWNQEINLAHRNSVSYLILRDIYTKTICFKHIRQIEIKKINLSLHSTLVEHMTNEFFYPFWSYWTKIQELLKISERRTNIRTITRNDVNIRNIIRNNLREEVMKFVENHRLKLLITMLSEKRENLKEFILSFEKDSLYSILLLF